MERIAAQASPAADPAFEVASIKPADPNATAGGFRMMPGGGLLVTNFSLRQLITIAFDVRDFQIMGAPGWAGSERFDISARAEHLEGPTDPAKMTEQERLTRREQMRARLRTLLIDRFQLVFHRESKELPIYVLVQSKGGSKLPPAKGQEAQQSIGVGRGQTTAKNTNLQIFSNILAGQVGRPVLDESGLAGVFDFELTWVPEAAPGASDGSDSASPDGPTIFTAVQEQLGLKLESRKGPVDAIVIDKVGHPTEN